MFKTLTYIVTLFSFCFLLYSCANPKPLGGGPEDQTPPKVKRMIPENNSINYKGNTISIDFDEYVDAQKLRENIIFSPLIETPYDIVARKKNVTIHFQENFKENTTYSINFGESIKDVTRGNFAKDLNLAFSTGPYIDSLSITGFVYDFIKGKGLKDVSIELYSVSDTTTIRKHKPLYFAKTNGNGNFTINNIKNGTYTVYALNDLNNNFKYDNEKESIAFINNVVIDKKISKLKLGLTRSDTKGPEVVSTKQEYEYYLFTLNEGVESYKLYTDTKKTITDLSDDAKTIKLFNNFESKDSINIYCQFTDSSGNNSSDTIKVLFEPYKEKNKKNSFSLSIEPKNLEITKNEIINIKFNKPVNLINYPQVMLKSDTTLLKPDEKDFVIDSTGLKMSIVNKYSFKDTLLLTFQKGAFINTSGDSSVYFKAKFNYKEEEKYGILAGKVVCTEPNYIFQLLNNKEKVIDSRKNIGTFNYKWLEPGEYQLKLIIDVNNNGRWDATHLDNGLPPEPVYYYKEKITLRANWEILDLLFEVK